MTNNNLTLHNFKDSWFKIVDKGDLHYSTLSTDERIWYNIQIFINQVDNGGLISFYYNSYAEYVNETIEDLINFGFPDIADLLKQINGLFPNGQPSLSVDERNEAISNWPDGKYDSLLDSLDEYFYEKEGLLEQKLFQHIQNKLGIVATP